VIKEEHGEAMELSELGRPWPPSKSQERRGSGKKNTTSTARISREPTFIVRPCHVK